MLNYAVVEINGKQFRVTDKPFEVPFLGEAESVEGKVIAKSDGDFNLGTPYLKETLKFRVVGQKNKKIRVATYKSKSNYRRVKGSKTTLTTLILEEKAVKKG